MMCSGCKLLSDVAAFVEVYPVQVVYVVLEGKAFAEWDLVSAFSNSLKKSNKKG